ncbi:MAG: type III restriction-modification system endonuclease, partial [Bacteroidia bacterium]
VGRGLRLPVNEYGNRVKDEQFYLNYFVDFTESDFVDKLVSEINEKSGAISVEKVYDNLNDNLIKIILEKYPETFSNANQVLEFLDDNGVVKRNNDFKEGGYEFIKQNYPLIFEGVNSNKVRKATDPKKKVIIRTEKYQELKDLWEKLNEKVILEYKFNNEAEFKTLLTEFLKAQKNDFTSDGINERILTVDIKDNKAVVSEPESVYNRKTASISTMKYSNFLKELAKNVNVNINTLHQSIIDANIDINSYLSQTTLRGIKQNFDYYLMANAIDKFSIEYKKVSNNIHPTKLTDSKGNVLQEYAPSGDIGTLRSPESVATAYFFDELYYDSDLEKTNIKTNIEEVIVFTKIPKNSIKIPVAGGKSYSPDFAYVVKFKGGEQKLNFIVETKDVNSKEGLRDEEKFKIKHAEHFFDGKVKIEFRTQFSNNKIVDLIKEITLG